MKVSINFAKLFKKLVSLLVINLFGPLFHLEMVRIIESHTGFKKKTLNYKMAFKVVTRVSNTLYKYPKYQSRHHM